MNCHVKAGITGPQRTAICNKIVNSLLQKWLNSSALHVKIQSHRVRDKSNSSQGDNVSSVVTRVSRYVKVMSRALLGLYRIRHFKNPAEIANGLVYPEIITWFSAFAIVSRMTSLMLLLVMKNKTKNRRTRIHSTYQNESSMKAWWLIQCVIADQYYRCNMGS